MSLTITQAAALKAINDGFRVAGVQIVENAVETTKNFDLLTQIVAGQNGKLDTPLADSLTKVLEVLRLNLHAIVRLLRNCDTFLVLLDNFLQTVDVETKEDHDAPTP